MGWSRGFDSNWNRDIGYGVPSICDSPKCNKKIDRGLSYVCGGEPYGGERGCGLYFCGKHLLGVPGRCTRCVNYRSPYKPKPDVPEWIKFKKKEEKENERLQQTKRTS